MRQHSAGARPPTFLAPGKVVSVSTCVSLLHSSMQGLQLSCCTPSSLAPARPGLPPRRTTARGRLQALRRPVAASKVWARQGGQPVGRRRRAPGRRCCAACSPAAASQTSAGLTTPALRACLLRTQQVPSHGPSGGADSGAEAGREPAAGIPETGLPPPPTTFNEAEDLPKDEGLLASRQHWVAAAAAAGTADVKLRSRMQGTTPRTSRRRPPVRD